MITATPLFDAGTSTFSYILFDQKSHDCVIIDPVLDFDPINAVISTDSCKRIKEYLEQNDLNVRMIIDTHVHADHITAAAYLKHLFGVPSAIGENFIESQSYFAELYELKHELSNYEPAYDFLLKHDQVFSAGALRIKTLLTPGHTPSCASFLIDDLLFCGDLLFQPELGCGRADFPGASAQTLYRSVKNNIYTQPDTTKLYIGHDYPQGQEAPRAQTTVGESKQKNIMIDNIISEEDFIIKRTVKDKNLQAPRLLLAAMQLNILGGQLPKTSKSGKRFLRVPLSCKL
jgi:glyoxylase-like metal-dependent hydrolase (beta-lactamase superfamily II)